MDELISRCVFNRHPDPEFQTHSWLAQMTRQFLSEVYGALRIWLQTGDDDFSDLADGAVWKTACALNTHCEHVGFVKILLS